MELKTYKDILYLIEKTINRKLTTKEVNTLVYECIKLKEEEVKNE